MCIHNKYIVDNKNTSRLRYVLRDNTIEIQLMNTMQSSVKGYVMITLAKDDNQRTIVQALSITEAKRILKQQTGLDWYFKGYAGN